MTIDTIHDMRGLLTFKGKPDNSNGATFSQRWASWGDLTADSEAGAELLERTGTYGMPVREVRKNDDTFHFQNHADATTAARMGWHEGTAQLLSAVDAIAEQIGEIAETLSNTMIYDVAGELPDVGAYCAGIQEHMISWPMEHASKPVVKLAIGCAKSHFITAEQSANWGAGVIALVDALELAGRDVELILYNAGCNRNGTRLQYLTVKPAGEQIDRDRLAFALVSADMLRRTMLSALGDNSAHTYGSGYGMPANLGGIAVVLPKIAPELIGVLDVIGFGEMPSRDAAAALYGTPQSALDTVINWARDAGIFA